MLRSSLCEYSKAYILASITLTVPNTAAAGTTANNRKNMIIKNCALYTNYISYSLIECSHLIANVLIANVIV